MTRRLLLLHEDSSGHLLLSRSGNLLSASFPLRGGAKEQHAAAKSLIPNP